jgi:hypothetical protein
MKKPLYNELERWQMRNIECTSSSFMLLNIAWLRFAKSLNIDNKLDNILNYIGYGSV